MLVIGDLIRTFTKLESKKLKLTQFSGVSGPRHFPLGCTTVLYITASFILCRNSYFASNPLHHFMRIMVMTTQVSRITKVSCIKKSNQIFMTVYSPYYVEACNEWRGPSPRLSAWATQLRRNVATVASRWRHCDDLTDPEIEPQTSRTDGVRLASEQTGRYSFMHFIPKFNSGEFPLHLHEPRRSAPVAPPSCGV